ncbi:MAG: PilW family protein [Lachnospiraceae bacterium]
MKNNKGISLIELIVAVSMVAIVGGALLSFIVTSTNMYKRQNSEISLQEEAQLAVNQVENLIINATNGVRFLEVSDAGSGLVTERTLYMYNKETGGNIVTKISWMTSTKQLLYSTYQYTTDISGADILTPIITDELMAEYVNSFSVDLSDLESRNLIKLSLDFLFDSRNYKTDKDIKIRNDILQVASDEEAFTSGGDQILIPNVTDVVISPSTAYTWQGSVTSGFSAAVIGTNFPMQDVIWDFTDETKARINDTNTVISSFGVVTLGENETCTPINIQAISTQSVINAEGDASQYIADTASVLTKSIQTISLSNSKQTDALEFKADLIFSGQNFESTDNFTSGIYFTYTYEGNPINDVSATVEQLDAATSQARYKTVFSTENTAYEGKTIQVTPIYQRDAKIYTGVTSSFTFGIEAIRDIAIVIKDSNGNWTDYTNMSYTSARGAGFDITLKVKRSTSWSGEISEEYIPFGSATWKQIKWSLVDSSENPVSLLGTPSSGRLNVPVNWRELTADQEYKYLLQATYNGWKVDPVTVIIPKVSFVINEKAEGQDRYPLQVNRDQDITFRVTGLTSRNYSVYCLDNKNAANISTDGATILGQESSTSYNNPQIFTFGIKDSSGNVIAGITDHLRIDYGTSNLFQTTWIIYPVKYTLTDLNLYLFPGEWETILKEYKGSSYYLLDGTKVTCQFLNNEFRYTVNGTEYQYSAGSLIWYSN